MNSTTDATSTFDNAEPFSEACSEAGSDIAGASRAPRAAFTEEEEDRFPMPTYEQVERSMARALRFQNACPHQEEFARQVIEGRKMTRAEGQPQRKERDGSFQAHSHAPAPQPRSDFGQNQNQGQNQGQGAKKRRSRNRNRSGKPAGAPTFAG